MIAQVEEYFPLEVPQAWLKGCTSISAALAGVKSGQVCLRRKIVISGGKLPVLCEASGRLLCYKSGIDGLIGIEDNARTIYGKAQKGSMLLFCCGFWRLYVL